MKGFEIMDATIERNSRDLCRDSRGEMTGVTFPRLAYLYVENSRLLAEAAAVKERLRETIDYLSGRRCNSRLGTAVLDRHRSRLAFIRSVLDANAAEARNLLAN